MFPRPESLMTPGPTPVPPEVLLAQGSPLVYHRGPGFAALLHDVAEGIQWLLQTKNDVLTLTCSGTGGLECAVANSFSPGDKVINVSIGAFGERAKKLQQAFGLDVIALDYEWGKAAQPDDIEHLLQENPDAKGVMVTHSETSTGTINDIAAIGEVLKRHDALFIVDTVSGAGGAEIRVDDWGVDVAIAGSQKALGAAPGVAWVSVSEAAWKANEVAKCPRFYFDWKKAKEFVSRPEPETPWTPAISTLMGVQASLRMLRAEGRDIALERHRILSQATREGLVAIGLQLFSEVPERGTTVTCVIADSFDGEELVARVRSKFGIILAGGQAKLKGKIFRVGHLGYVDRSDIIKTLAAIETVLNEMGYLVKSGAAIEAAQQVFRDADAAGTTAI